MRHLIAKSTTRRIINIAYNHIPHYAHQKLYEHFAKIFRRDHVEIQSGFWCVKFCESLIRVPLNQAGVWLAWDLGLAILGNDSEVKRTYRWFLSLDLGPQRFLDVGSNFGTHSVIFLVHHIPTISVEPNPSCKPFFDVLCAANAVTHELHQVALGTDLGSAELFFPSMEEWLGTIEPGQIASLQQTSSLVRISVLCISLDVLFQGRDEAIDLIKLDTEGSELGILKGASEVVRKHRPIIIFESLHGDARKLLFDHLRREEYSIVRLPLSNIAPYSLTSAEFLGQSSTNFAAIHRKRLALWPSPFRPV